MVTPSLQYVRRTVDREDRDAMLRLHFRPDACPDPSAGNDPRMVALLAYLHVPSHACPESGRPVLSASILAGIEGREAEFASKNYVGSRLLYEYRARVDPSFGWTDYDMNAGNARSASAFKVYPNVRDRIRDRTGPAPEGRRVYADDGAPASRKSQARELAAARDSVQQGGAPVLCDEQRRLVDYLNTLPSNRFTAAYDAHHADAYALNERLLQTGEITRGQYESARVALATMGDQPTPVYSPSRSMRTQRVFPVTPGLATMRSEISAVFRRDWATYDLQSAQTAINAREWHASNLVDFLAETVSDDNALWRRLFGAVGLDYDALQGSNGKVFKAAKRALKAALYSVQYGKKPEAVMQSLDRALAAHVSRAGARLFDDPLMQEIADRRAEAYKDIRAAGGAETCFGDWVALEPGRDEASIAAQCAQARELSLLMPALGLATATKRWGIVLWQHDGFDVAVADTSRINTYDREIRAAVDEECVRLGVPTRLVGVLPSGKGVGLQGGAVRPQRRAAARASVAASRSRGADRPAVCAVARATTEQVSGAPETDHE